MEYRALTPDKTCQWKGISGSLLKRQDIIIASILLFLIYIRIADTNKLY